MLKCMSLDCQNLVGWKNDLATDLLSVVYYYHILMISVSTVFISGVLGWYMLTKEPGRFIVYISKRIIQKIIRITIVSIVIICCTCLLVCYSTHVLYIVKQYNGYVCASNHLLNCIANT
jgi:hypothetical protein